MPFAFPSTQAAVHTQSNHILIHYTAAEKPGMLHSTTGFRNIIHHSLVLDSALTNKSEFEGADELRGSCVLCLLVSWVPGTERGRGTSLWSSEGMVKSRST